MALVLVHINHQQIICTHTTTILLKLVLIALYSPQFILVSLLPTSASNYSDHLVLVRSQNLFPSISCAQRLLVASICAYYHHTTIIIVPVG